MIEFGWLGIQKGDKVKVAATKESLQEIYADEFHNCIGTVTRIQDKYITVKFINDTRMFGVEMLEKVAGDSIDTYGEWLDSPEGSLYTDEMNTAYGEWV